MASKTWIEVAVNGAAGPEVQTGIPISAEAIVEDAVSCVKAGAAIVHAHSLDPRSGRQNGDVENCARFIEGIRSHVDAIVFPGIGDLPLPEGRARFAPELALSDRGLLDWVGLDPGSCNFGFANPHRPIDYDVSSVYVNRVETLELGLDLAAERRFHISYACFEPGFARMGRALHERHPVAPAPIYRFMFSSLLTFGLPASALAVDAYASMMQTIAPEAPWMIAGLAFDVLPLIPRIVALGGHVRVGLEDAPYHSPRSNRELVEAAVAAVRAAGSEPATAAEVRRAIATC